MENLRKSKRGFTIIELIVVIAVLGILVLLGMPRLLGHVEKSKITVIRHDVRVAENKMSEVLLNGDEEFINADNSSEWSQGYVDEDKLTSLITDGKLFEKEGLVNEVPDIEEIDLSQFKIIPESVRESIKTRLPGDFYADAGGKVYYEREKGTVVAANCQSQWVEQPNHPLLSALMPVVGFNEADFDIKSYNYKGTNYLYAWNKDVPENVAGLNIDIFLSVYGDAKNTDPDYVDVVQQAFQDSFVYDLINGLVDLPPVTCEVVNGNKLMVRATDIETVSSITKIKVFDENNGSVKFLYFHRMTLQNGNALDAGDMNSQEGVTTPGARMLFAAGSNWSSVANTFTGYPIEASTEDVTFLKNGYLKVDASGNPMFLNGGIWKSAVNPYTSAKIKSIYGPIVGDNTRVLYEDGTFYTVDIDWNKDYSSFSYSFTKVNTGSHLIKDIAGDYLLTTEGKAFYHNFREKTLTYNYNSNVPGVVYTGIFSTGHFNDDENAVDANGNEYNISNIDTVKNNSHLNYGKSPAEGRDYRFQDGKIERAILDWNGGGYWEEIDYGNLNKADITKVVYGNAYILILDKSGNVWTYGIYDGWIS